MSPGISMAKRMNHAMTGSQSASGRLCTSCLTNGKPHEKVHNGQPLANRRTSEAASNKCIKMSVGQDHALAAVFPASSSVRNHKTTQQINEPTKKLPLHGKMILLKWWLDTMGQGKPLRSAWENDEESVLPLHAETKSRCHTFVNGQCLSSSCLHDSDGFTDVSKLKTTCSGVSGQTNCHAGESPPQQTCSKPLLPHLMSRSSELTFNQSASQNQQNNVKVIQKDSSTSRDHYTSQQQPRFDKTQSWPKSRNMQDQNASSNVVTAQRASHCLLADDPLVEVSSADNGQTGRVLDIINKPIQIEESTLWHGKPDIRMTEKSSSCQNDSQNSQIPLLSLLPSQLSIDRSHFSSDRDVLKSLISQTSNSNIIAFSEEKTFKQQTSPLKNTINCISYGAISCNKQWENNRQASKSDVSFNNTVESFSVYAHNKVPVNGTLPDCSYTDDSNNSVNARICPKPNKYNVCQEQDNANLSCNKGISQRIPTPDLVEPQGESCTFAELDNNLKQHQTTLKKQPSNDPEHDNSHLKFGVSYFHRLVEKKFKTNGHLNNCLDESSSQSLQISCNEGQGGGRVSAFTSYKRQSEGETHSPSAADGSGSSCNSKLTDSQRKTNEHTQSLDCGHVQGCTELDCKKTPSIDLFCASSSLPAQADNGHRDYSQTLGKPAEPQSCLAVCPTKQDHLKHSVQYGYSKTQSDDNPSTKTLFNNQNENQKHETKQTSVQQHTSNTCLSQYSNEDLMPENIFHNEKYGSLEWVSRSFSNSSLPQDYCQGYKACQIKLKSRHAESVSKTRRQRQREIIDRAKLLIFMLEKLPLSDRAWEDNFPDVERSDTVLKCKNVHRFSKKTAGYSNLMSTLRKYDSYNKGKLSTKIKNEDSQQSAPAGCSYGKIISSESTSALPQHSNILPTDLQWPSYPEEKSNKKEETNSTLNRSSNLQSKENIDSSKRRITKPQDQTCKNSANKRSKDVSHTQHNIPEGNNECEQQKQFYTIFPQCLFKNVPNLTPSPTCEVTAEMASIHPNSETKKASSGMPDKDKPSCKKILNNREHKNNEAPVKPITKKKIFDTLSQEEAQKQLEMCISKVAAENNSQNTQQYTPFGGHMISCGRLISQNLRPSEIEAPPPNMLPSLSKKVPVYPKPRPNALGGVQDEDSIVACDLPTVSESPVELSSTQTWTKPILKKKRPTSCSRLNTTPLKNQSVKCAETLKVLPPLQCANSENSNSKTIGLHNCSIPSSVTTHEKQREDLLYSDGGKQYGTSLEHSDSVPAMKCRPKCISPDHLRKIYRKIPLASTHSPGLFLSPLRRKFDRTKYKVSDGLLRLTPSSKHTTHLTASLLCRNVTTDNPAMEQHSEPSLQASIPETDAPNLPHLPIEDTISNWVGTCGSHQLPSSFPYFNKTVKESFNAENNISKANCQCNIPEILINNKLVNNARNEQESNPRWSDVPKDNKICLQSKQTLNFASSPKVKSTDNLSRYMPSLNFQTSNDLEMDKIYQKNECNSLEPESILIERNARTETKHTKKLCRRSKGCTKKPKCPGTGSFKFLMLLLSDDPAVDNV